MVQPFVPADPAFIQEPAAPRLPPDLPALSAAPAAEVAARSARLRTTFLWASETVRRLSSRYQLAWDGAITSLHDDGGRLVVTWRDRDSRLMFEGVIIGAWQLEAEELHGHKVEG